MNLFSKCFLLFTFVFSSLYSQSIDELGIKVTSRDRQYVFTNKEAGTYQGEVNAKNSGGWQGWFINAEKIFHDYSLNVNGKILDRSSARSTVYPHQLIRKYPDGIMETVTLLDSIDVMLIEVNNPFAQLVIEPTDNFRKDSPSTAAMEHWIRTNAASPIVPTDIVIARRMKRNVVVFAVATGRSAEQLRSLSLDVAIRSDQFVTSRKNRMQAVLDLSPVTTNDKELTTVIAWAKLQLDALIMNQSTGGARTKGIFAGLPWFNNYWGRDSFISLPGATYVIGNFTDARDVLRSYAKFQELDTNNTNYGRIPNLATPQSVIYNTADGAPWFVKSLYEYVKYSGDVEFIKEMYPVIVRSIEGTLKFHSDTLGLLTHADAESWMDAVGPNGPWSPRGNRACDVQTLWHQQLMVGAFCAEYFNDFSNAARWKNVADKLEKNFQVYFVDKKNNLIYDHLRADGTPSEELRPNQLFSIDMMIPEDVRQNSVRTVLGQLVYEHGTATLAQNDSNFHPFHESPPYYVKDAAYHNGTIWTWLNGAAVYGATRYDLQDVIYPVTKNSIHQMLRRGTVGTLSELLDAHPRGTNEPKLSGTFSQAWSLAEFIRSMYQDYFGVSVDVPSKVIRIQPKLPKEITSVQFEQRVEKGSVVISYKWNKDRVITTITPKGLQEKFGINYLWVHQNGDAVTAPVDMIPEQTVRIEHTATSIIILNNGKKIFGSDDDPKIFLRNFSDRKYFTGLTLAQPEVKRTFPVLRGPTHPLLKHAVIKQKNPNAVLLAEQTDPAGDDKGTYGTFRYPENQQFQQGILDITGATFRYDDKNLYCRLTFTNLADPGWHPEYGFQLTIAAIAINSGGGTQRNVGVNSNYLLDSSQAFDRMILVGGGLRVLSGDGQILCEYIPQTEDFKDPLGNTTSKSIEFALPLEYLGKPDPRWKMTILVGGQDDHGGAGIGEFRSVEQAPSEWLGGGKNNANESNVFDVMIVN
ncbi:MAG: amylo-alpha-1,6-glucosidase [Bacteroidota bacterium]